MLLAQFQVVAARAVVGTFGPVEGFDGLAEGFQIGQIFCFQMFGKLPLDIDDAPKIFFRALRLHTFHNGLQFSGYWRAKLPILCI